MEPSTGTIERISKKLDIDGYGVASRYLELLDGFASEDDYFLLFLDLLNADNSKKEQLKRIIEENPYPEYNLVAALQTIQYINDILKSKELIPQNTLERILRSFFAIAAKDYYSPEELMSLFSSIEVREGTGKHAAKREGNALILYDSIFAESNSKPDFNDERIEYFILHEIGHIIDTSGVLEVDYERGSGVDDDYESEMEKIVSEIPLSMQDSYSIENGELGYHEAIAHLTAIWAKHQSDFDGFLFERLIKTNPDTIKTIFGDNEQELARMFHECKDNPHFSTVVRKYIKDEKLFNILFENSHRVFNHLSHNWSQAKKVFGDEFFDRLAHIEEDGYDDLFGSAPELMPEPDVPTERLPGEGNDNYAPDASLGKAAGQAKPAVQSTPIKKPATFGEVFKAGIEFIKAIDEINPFQ